MMLGSSVARSNTLSFKEKTWRRGKKTLYHTLVENLHQKEMIAIVCGVAGWVGMKHQF